MERTWQSAQIVEHETRFKSYTIEKFMYKINVKFCVNWCNFSFQN
jgi:hypothetical protein